MPAANRALCLALAGAALLLAATLAAYRPPAPLGKDAPPSAFSAYRARAILEDLVGSGIPHPIGSAAAAQMRKSIMLRLSALGYAPQLQSGFVCKDGVCGSPVNIVAKLDGTGAEKDSVLLAAHYDSVPAGPGASDDAASVAAVLEIARILAARPRPRHSIVLLLTDGEEAGLLGASLFVQEHPLSKQVKAAVNMDARGTSGPSLMFETGTANAWLMRLYESAIARPFTNSLYYVVYKQLPNDTDFTVFKAAEYQGFNLAYIGNVGRYHTPLDNFTNANPGSIQHQGDNALALVSALADSPTLHPPISESVFFDAFARVLIAWPAGLTLPAALLSLALLLGETVILVRKGAVAGRAIAWGAVGTLCVLVSGAALCAGLLAVALAVGKVPPLKGESWISQPLPMHVAAAAIAFLAACCAGGWLARRAGFWGFWAAVNLLVAVLSVACAIAVPGVSFVLLLTAVAAGLGALPAALDLARSRMLTGWTTDIAALLPCLVIFGGLFPQLRFLYVGLGSLAWPLSTLLLCFGTSALLPLLAAASARARQRVLTAAALLAVGGAVLTFSLPTYSADWPERINLEYWLDIDSGRSNYLARCDSSRLPAALAAAAHFDPVSRPRFAGSASAAFYAAAPKLELAAPELSLTSPPRASSPAQGSQPASSASATHFELRLRSLRGAPEALVVFPASAQVAQIVLRTPAGLVRAPLSPMQSGATLIDFVSLPAEGVEFSVDAAGRSSLAVQVFDQSYDFPEGHVLQRARPPNATSSQDGDVTVVHRTVSLDPAADR
jgi:Peptidase family M28